MPLPEFEWSDITPNEQRSISRLRPTEDDMLDPTSLPLLSESAIAKTNKFYGIYGNDLTVAIADRVWRNGRMVASDFYQQIQFANAKEGVTFGDMLEPFFKKFFEGDIAQMNGAAIGGGYILLSLFQEMGKSFMDRLGQVDFEEADEAISTSLIQSGKFIPFSERGSIFRSSQLRTELPTYQQHLRGGISIVSRIAACEPCVQFGGVAIYNTIDAIWEAMNEPLLELPEQTASTPPGNGIIAL